MSDGFLLATRSLLAPRSVPGEEIRDVYVRSRNFWKDQEASTFVAMAATFAYLVNDDFEQAAQIVDETPDQDWFAHLARGFLALRQGEASVAVESLTAASAMCAAPRSIAITGVLLAAAHLHLDHAETAATTLHTAVARSSAPLIRFALRLVPTEDFQGLEHAASERDPELASAFVATDPRPLHGPSRIRLTHVERELIALLRQGLSNAQIAEKRIVSINTVRTQVRNLMRKLSVRDRHEAVQRVDELGLQ